MEFLYSPSTNAFYDPELSYHDLPDDVIEIGRNVHTEMMQAQADGLVISCGPEGMPIALPAPPPTAEERTSTNAAVRDRLLTAAALHIAPLQDSVDLDLASSDDKTKLKAWKTYRIEVSKTVINAAEPAWPSPPR